MKNRAFLSILLLLALCPPVCCRATTFDADSAYAYAEHLSVTIGPRPMGSASERLALDWVAEKFLSFGADSVFIMKFDRISGGHL